MSLPRLQNDQMTPSFQASFSETDEPGGEWGATTA